MMKSRLSGFTIMEIAIAIAVGVVVVGIGFNALSMSHKRNAVFTDSMDRLNKGKLAHWVIKADLLKAKAVVLTSNGFGCFRAHDTINYVIGEEWLIRKQARSDTLIRDLTSIDLRMNNRRQHIPFGLVDEVIIKTKSFEPRWYFEKWYDLYTLREYEH